jgi:MFS family permease
MSPSALWLRLVPAYAAGYYLSYALRNVNAVISPDLVAQFGLSDNHLGLLTSTYFLAFGLFQLPLGVLLDRFGPRRVEVVLLLVAALGCALFGLAHHWGMLVAARALIGLGVSACLMGSFKAFAQWFPPERLPALNATIMVAGGLGILSVSVPVAWALPLLGWRGIFGVISALLALSALALWFTPDGPLPGATPLREQWRGLLTIYRHRRFWRFAPQGCLIAGGAMAVQGLWMVPWLIQVDGLSRDQAAQVVLLVGAAMLSGFLLVATASTWLTRQGWTPMRLLQSGVALGLLAELSIVTHALPAALSWSLFGFAFSLTNIAYSQLAQAFAPSLAGRVNTALNLVVFIGAFGLQWGLGAGLQSLVGLGWTQSQAFVVSLSALLLAQSAAFVWFLWPEPASIARTDPQAQ